MILKPIFSDNLLSHYLSDFSLLSVTDIRGKFLLIKSLVNVLDSGKIGNSKEEEIKPRFINTFFGDIMGFNYGNSNEWQLRYEKKSVVDGTKPDAALGYFFIDNYKDDVRAVIEIKDANTDLDTKQKKPYQQSAVEQAFGYVSKMGGNCRWVIVSNIKETRFYPSLDRSKYQVFYLKDLINEPKLKEFLFLFHKDRFIKANGKSPTDLLLEKVKGFQSKDDKAIHIIDKIYNSLKRFEGFGFVDPNYIVTIFPFNILSEHVWQYHNRNLLTINNEIYDLLSGMSIENDEVVFTNEMQSEIDSSNVVDAKHKMEWSFKFLNHCLIDEISAVKNYKQIADKNKRTIGFSYRNHFGFKEVEEGITKNIWLIKNNNCDCLSCNYRSLDFNKFLGKLKTGLGNEDFINTEYAYGNYLAATNNFKTTYNIYKTIEKELKGIEGKEVEYFLTKQNIKHLHNLVWDYDFADSQDILNNIKSVDLDKVIYDEIEFSVDKEVKKYLIDVKEDALIYKLQDEIEEIAFSIDKLKQLYKNGGKQNIGPNLPNKLSDKYFLLYLHVNRNYIVYDIFTRYKSLAEKVFKGLVTSYSTPEVGLKLFNDFFLTEAILHVCPSGLQEILKNVNDLKTTDDCIEIVLEKLTNFLTSYYKDGLFSDHYENKLLKEQLNNYRFKERFTDIFSNLFTVLSRLNISKEQFSKSKSQLIKFLTIEDELAWFDLKELSNFVIRKGDLFEATELIEILKVAIEGDKYGMNKYPDFIKNISNSLVKFYPESKIDNSLLIDRAILNCFSDEGKSANFCDIVYLVNACNDNCKQNMFNHFEKQLDKKFDSELYESLLQNTSYDYNTKNYFQFYSEQINKTKGGRAFKFGELKLTDLVFINYIFIIYRLKIDFNRNELKSFTNLNDFETWLLNPIDFDYEKFRTIWLIDIHDPVILDRMKNIEQISAAIELELKKEFNSIIAEIKYKYFSMTD